MKLNENNSKAPYILTINKINTEFKKQNINKNNNKKEFIFKQYGSVFCFEPACEKFQYVAAFDLDWTLSYNEKHLFHYVLKNIS